MSLPVWARVASNRCLSRPAPLGASAKDQLDENKLHAQVCSGAMAARLAHRSAIGVDRSPGPAGPVAARRRGAGQRPDAHLGVSRATAYRALQQADDAEPPLPTVGTAPA